MSSPCIASPPRAPDRSAAAEEERRSRWEEPDRALVCGPSGQAECEVWAARWRPKAGVSTMAAG
eukprot:11801899-Alexandrium_andersonii.AAC.1